MHLVSMKPIQRGVLSERTKQKFQFQPTFLTYSLDGAALVGVEELNRLNQSIIEIYQLFCTTFLCLKYSWGEEEEERGEGEGGKKGVKRRKGKGEERGNSMYSLGVTCSRKL